MINFSIIIPLYNKEKDIASTLMSVLKQSYQPNEIIVVDDGSTDKSVKIVENLFKDKVKLVKQTNKGISAARNRGIKEARNEFICFLDADDLWEKDFLKEIALLIENFPEAVFYSTSHKIIDENGRVIEAKVFKENFFGIIDNFFKIYKDYYGLINSSSVCIKKSTKIFFPEGEARGEDICTWIKLALKGKLAFSAKSLAIYRLNASNRSNKSNNKEKIPCQLKWFYSNKNKTNKKIQKFIHSNILVNVYEMALNGDYKNVRATIKYMKKNRDIFFLFVLPSLIVPRRALSLVRSLKRKFKYLYVE